MFKSKYLCENIHLKSENSHLNLIFVISNNLERFENIVRTFDYSVKFNSHTLKLLSNILL